MFESLLNKPQVVAIIGDINTGKSNLLYSILEETAKKHKFNLFYYGLRLDFNKVTSQRVYSVREIESIKDSVIIIDELSSLFDLDNRKSKRIIENTLRLINHNNNILLLCGTPENFKKFLSAKLDKVIFKYTTIADCINGSVVKHILTSYKGYELGSEILNLSVGECLLYDGVHYKVLSVPYLKQYDSKKDNKQILTKRGNKTEQKAKK